MKKSTCILIASILLISGCGQNNRSQTESLPSSSESQIEESQASSLEESVSIQPSSRESESSSASIISSIDEPLEIQEEQAEALFCSAVGSFAKEGEDYFIVREIWSYPQEEQNLVKTKLLDVRFEPVAAYSAGASYFGIPDCSEKEWTFEVGGNYRVFVRVDFTFEGSKHSYYSFLGINKFDLSVSEGASVDRNVIKAEKEGVFSISFDIFGTVLTKKVSAKLNVYDHDLPHRLNLSEGVLTPIISVSPMKASFHEGDEFEFEFNIVYDGPGSSFLTNGVWLPSFSNKISMPPFDCQIDGVVEYTYFPE